MWWFVSPRIAFGEDALDYLEEVKARKAVIVTEKPASILSALAPFPTKGKIYKGFCR